jgi:hypothetical protein
VAVTTPTPQARRRLPKVYPDLTEALEIIALSHHCLGFIRLYFNNFIV